MKQRRLVFQFSKPFQYFNIKNIPYTTPQELKVLVAIRAFFGFDEFVERIRKYDGDRWDEIVIVENEKGLRKYLLFHKVHALFTPYDTSTLLGCVVLLKRFKVFWFEEGMTTYMDICERKSFVHVLVDKLLGVGRRMGTSSYTIGCYVYRHDIYHEIFKESRVTLLNYEYDFRRALTEYSDLFFKLSSTDKNIYDSIRNKNIAIYLTDWYIDSGVIERLEAESQNYDIFYVKPHPHVLDIAMDFPSCFTVIKSNILFEFLAQCFLDNGNRLAIYHHNSNAVLHFLKDTKVISLAAPEDTSDQVRIIYELFSK